MKAPTRIAPKVAWPLAVVVATAVFGTIPTLVTKWFYQRGDTAVQFAPTWYHLGRLTRDGVFPAWLDPGTWAGGNYGAEALFGIYDPLNIPVWLFMSASSDLMVSTFLVKLCFLVLLALGTYLLAREYDAAPWAAAAVAVALPFSGFTLFWDAASWASGLIAFSYTPWVWLVLRRVRRGASNPFWGFVVGALAVTQGNPYGVLALVVIGLALVVEGLLEGDRAGVLKLVGAGVTAALVLPLVYLPLLGTSSLTVRSLGALIANTGKMQPAPGDLFQLSMPTAVPPIHAIAGQMAVPATFLAWFVLPLLPWLRWSELRARALVGPLGVGVVYLGLVLAPSKLWQFRWPLRVSEYLYLAVVVLFARALTAGLASTHVRRRVIGSAVVIAVPSYLAWAQNPAALHRLVWGTLLVAVLTAVALLAWRLGPARTLALGCVLIVGTGLGVALQLRTFGENKSSRVWHVPSDVSALQSRFGDRTGVVIQFSDFRQLQQTSVTQLQKQWQFYLPGSMYDVAGVDAVNHYTGMGLVRFERRLCMSYDGFTRPCGYANLWRPLQSGFPPLADLMKVDTVVVDPSMVGKVTIPAGWQQVSTASEVLVYHRTQPEPWPDSHLSYVPQGATVTSAVSDDVRHEHVQLSSTGAGGTAVFGMLGWPGWTATLDGHPVAVGRDPAGLLTVRLPAQKSGRLELTYEPPGLKVGAAAAALGLLGAVALGWFGRRRKDGDEIGEADERPADAVDEDDEADEDDEDDEAREPASSEQA